jgi:hypothetical protein
MSNRRLAVILRVLTWIGAVLVVLMPTLMWAGPHDGIEAARGPLLPILRAGDTSQRLAALALFLPPYLIVAWGLIQLSGFCGRLTRGEHFSRAAASALKRFGWSLIGAAALLPLSRVIVWAYVMDGTGWHDLLHAALRTMPLLASALGLLLGSIVIVFASILKQATEIAEENARFV